MPHEPTFLDDERAMRRSYVRVVIVWVVTLAALYGLQAWFA
jgi:hypothetical protein